MVLEKKVMTKGKKSIGRQRIEIKELDDRGKQQVTFSKRRTGLFKKASELCVLCGAEVAVFVFSQKKNMYSFGHPNVETILERYLDGKTMSDSSSSSQELVPVDEFNMQYDQLQKELEKEKMHLVEIEKMNKKMKNTNVGFWWDEPFDENMGLEEMEQYMKALQEVRRKVGARIEKFRMPRTSLMQPMNMPMGLGNDFVNVNSWESNACGGFLCWNNM